MSSSSSSSSSVSSESSAPTNRGIYLRRAAQTRYVVNAVDGFRFQVLAHDAYLMDNRIFRYLRHQADPVTGEEKDTFDGVCSPADLEEYPPDAPNGTPPFFRRDEVDLVFRSQFEADDVWQGIKDDVVILVETLNLMDDMVVSEDIRIGSPS